MPMDKARYPADWPAISRRVREEAGQRCEWCGVANGAVGARDKHGRWHDENAIHCLNSGHGLEWFGTFPKMVKIVLTVAHLDHDTTNNDRGNLRALCQKCHLGHDRELHQRNAAGTRQRKRDAKGRQLMFGEELT